MKAIKDSFFHGTSATAAKTLKAGKIDVTVGGGELGQGFYTAEWLWVAKAWAAQVHPKSPAVLKLEMIKADFDALDPLLLSRIEALTHRKNIRSKNATRTHLFNRHVVWSPIVGGYRPDADQFKYEGDHSQSLLNGSAVNRTVV